MSKITNIKITKQTVTAGPRKLKGTWTVESMEDEVVSLKEFEIWLMLRQARQDYWHLVRDVTEVHLGEEDFLYYMEQNWGVKIGTGLPGQIDNYEIVDEHKHTLFLLKYAGQH